MPPPETHGRPPERGLRIRSLTTPIVVHGAADTGEVHLKAALEHLEAAHDQLRAIGLTLPPADGGRGGDDAFDVYFGEVTTDVQAFGDAPDWLAPYDALLVHGRADRDLSPAELRACMTCLLAEAALLTLDPAESALARQASAIALTYLMTGELGCRRDTLALQRRTDRGLFRSGTEVETGLFLAAMSERQDGGSGAFLSGLWQFARQDSRDRVTLRASPDLFEAALRALENAHEDPDALLLDFAVVRYLAGRHASGHSAVDRLLRTRPVHAWTRVASEKLPKHVYAARNLSPFGSAYFEVDAAGLKEGDELRIWLRGDVRARYTVAAVSLAADGRELGRLNAPPRSQPDAYLPVRHSAGLATVVVAVVALPRGGFDIDDTRTPVEAGFKLIFDTNSK